MARLYHVDIARHAAGADPKWVDNLLSHSAIPGVGRFRQGASRRISTDGICHIALIRLLTSELNLAVNPATRLAARLLIPGGQRLVTLGDYLTLQFERDEFVGRVESQIADAVE